MFIPIYMYNEEDYPPKICHKCHQTPFDFVKKNCICIPNLSLPPFSRVRGIFDLRNNT